MCAEMPHPERLGRYEIHQLLASSSMGHVYRGLDPSTQKPVVLKTVPKEVLEHYGVAVAARLQHEAEAAARLHHPGIVETYEYGEDAGLAFVVEEFVQGWGVRRETRVPVADAVRILLQLLEALDYAHDQGVVHREIKPSNLLLTSEGRLRVTDFGVAKLRPGLPEYRSPEQFMGMPLDRRCDLFSAGVVFYELLTGVSPFAGPPESLVDRVFGQKERPPSTINTGVTRSLDAVCSKAMAKRIFDRYPTAHAFGAELLQVFESAMGPLSSRTVSSESINALRSPKGESSVKAPGMAAAGAQSSGEIRMFKWDEETLGVAERQLATFVGPLARVIIKEAASRTTDLERLYLIASESLQNEQDRKNFLAQRASASQSSSPLQTPAPAMRPPAQPAPPVPPKVPAPSTLVRATPEVKAESKPVVKLGEQRIPIVSKPESKPVAAVPPKPEERRPVKPEVKPPAKVEPAAAQPPSLDPIALQAAPHNMTQYLQDGPAQVEFVVDAFAAGIEALAELDPSLRRRVVVSPQNISINWQGKTVLRASQSTSGEGSALLMGNPQYAAPEIFGDKASVEDAAVTGAHVYAFGWIFYEILLGRTLFQTTFPGLKSDVDWMRWHTDLEKKAPPLKTLFPQYPVALSDLLETMMEKRLEKRNADLQAIRTGLRGVAQRSNRTMVLPRYPKTPVAPKAPVAAQKKTKKSHGLLIAMLVLMVLVAAVGAVLWLDPDLYRMVVSFISGLLEKR